MATLLGAYAVLQLLSGSCVEVLSRFMRRCFAVSGTPGLQLQDTLAELVVQMILVLLQTVGILAAVVVVCAIVATFFQTKMLVSGEALKPKLNRISPVQGFKRLFSFKSIVETIKGILKITVLLVIIYSDLTAMFRESSKYFYVDMSVVVKHLFDNLMSLVLHIALAFGVIAALDFLYQWWDYERQLKMTKQEVKEEYKQMEGDPQIKSKIRELQRRRAQSRMMQQVPNADVVIRNPTHYAVALRYKPEQDNAPVVLALGHDELALRIVKTAEEHHVAVIENPPLARSLFAQCELGQEIPPELYGVVAEVLVYIFRLNQDKRIVK